MLVRRVQERRGLVDPGVVDQDIQPAEPLDRLVDHLGRLPGVGGIDPHRHRVDAEGADPLHHRARGLLRLLVGQQDVEPVAGQADRDGRADAPARPRDDRHTPPKIIRHVSLAESPRVRTSLQPLGRSLGRSHGKSSWLV